MTWWIWLVVGFGLFLVEILTPGILFFAFFGVGALLVGILVELGLLENLASQLLVFTIFSVVSTLLFRKPLLTWLESRSRKGHAVDSIAGETAVLSEDLAPNGVGKAELRGTIWNVQNATATAMPSGQRCRVLRTEGLKLVVGPE